MSRQHIAAAVVLVAVLGPTVGLLLLQARISEREARRPKVGTIFPALTEERSSFAPTGRQQVVVFAKAGCGNCDRTITALTRLAVTEDFDLTAVVASARFADPAKDALHVVLDPEGSLSRRFGVIEVPLVFILDEESRVKATLAGERPEVVWRSTLAGEEHGR